MLRVLLRRLQVCGHRRGRVVSDFDAFPQRWPFQIVSRKKKAGIGALAVTNRFDDVAVAKIVLREGFRVTPDAVCDWRAGDLEHA